MKESYLFSRIEHKVAEFQEAHPEERLIRMRIGDVTRPLAPSVTAAMRRAVAEMGEREPFRGYGPEQGYDFLWKSIRKYYTRRDVVLSGDDIFVGDGAKSNRANAQMLAAALTDMEVPFAGGETHRIYTPMP